MRIIAIVVAVIFSGALAYAALLHSLPKPPGVPESVGAGFTLLNGMTWTWCEDSGRGSIRWTASERLGLSFSLYSALACSENREGGGRVFSWFGDGLASFPFHPSEPSIGGGQPCPFKISATERSGMAAVLERATASTSSEQRRRLLLEAKVALADLETSVLTTQPSSGSSCVAYPRHDARSSTE